MKFDYFLAQILFSRFLFLINAIRFKISNYAFTLKLFIDYYYFKLPLVTKTSSICNVLTSIISHLHYSYISMNDNVQILYVAPRSYSCASFADAALFFRHCFFSLLDAHYATAICSEWSRSHLQVKFLPKNRHLFLSRHFTNLFSFRWKK